MVQRHRGGGPPPRPSADGPDGYDPEAQGYVLEQQGSPYDPLSEDVGEDGLGYGANYPIADAATPDPAPPEMAYAVHTQACTYVLDQEGICRWIVARQGAVPPEVRKCVGAQFVACLDLASKGGLVPDLRLNAMGLFVRLNEQGRMVLLRTGPILRVDGGQPGANAAAASTPPPAFGDAPQQYAVLYGKKAGVPLNGPGSGLAPGRPGSARQGEPEQPGTRATRKPTPSGPRR